MAKKRKNKTKLPKRIAGVKIPKALRKSVPSVIALLDTPHGREAAAAALSAAAATLLGTHQGRHAMADAGGAAAGAGSTLAGGLESVGQVAGTVLKQAAQSMLPAGIIPEASRAEPEGMQKQAKAGLPKKQRGGSPSDPLSKH